MLEILHKQAVGLPKGNIVLIHGAWHGAWCWENNFLPYFAQKGYNVFAPSLRGHGNSGSNKKLNRLSINDYVEDVWSVVKDLEGDIYLIGHSMGGYIIQKFLEQHGSVIKKAVLIAAVPPNGVTLRPFKIIKTMGVTSLLKMNIMLDLYQAMNTPNKVRAVCFNLNDSDELVNYTASRVQGESFTAYIDMLKWKYINPKVIKTPILVVSGGNDWLFSTAEQQVIVDIYKVPQLMYPDKPHNLFATKGWEQVAMDIGKFLED
jgi:pimeloyl-ACP methyl ester carboxylesterase